MPKGLNAKLLILTYCPNCMLPVSIDETACKNCHIKFKKGVSCSNCGKNVEIESDICENCGAVFTAFYEYECPSCHHGVSHSEKKCRNCGKAILMPVRREITPIRTQKTGLNSQSAGNKPLAKDLPGKKKRPSLSLNKNRKISEK